MNPYEVLGVPKDATAGDIRLAFRREASKAHPDRGGGDDALMAAINSAYELLSDPERRKRYDETGTTQQGPTLRDEATHQIALAAQAVIEAGADDVLGSVLDAVEANRSDVADKIANLETRRRRLTKMLGRFKTKSAVNVVQGVIEQQLAGIPETEKRLKHAARVLAEASKVLAEYTDEQALLKPMLSSFSFHRPFNTGTMP